jgi:hypothetical protein
MKIGGDRIGQRALNASTLNDSKQNNDDRQHQQDVDEAAHRVGRNEPQ